VLDNAFATLRANPVDLALWVNAVTFLVSAVTIYTLQAIPRRVRDTADRPSVVRTLGEGWTFVTRTPLIRGLVVGILGATAAGGAVVGLARTYVADLGAGDPGYGVLFGAVFLGLAGGMGLGPRLLATVSRHRIFGLAIAAAGVWLTVLALIPNIVIAVIVTLAIGAFTGVAWVTGYTLLGLEVEDHVRGRTFAFVQSLVRIVLVLVLAIAPLLAAALGRHEIEFTESRSLTYNGAAITFMLAGLLAAALGIASYRQMDDRRGVPLRRDLAAALRGEVVPGPGESATGFFLAFEGGEGAGKSTQTRLLAEWLEAEGHQVLVTFEPGATRIGQQLRALLLDHQQAGLSARAEALLYAADRAEHVASVVRPALARGEIVITDRFIDSSVAYQGAGRELAPEDVRRVSRWATDGLVPNLTVLLDVVPQVGLRRGTAPLDRLESEPVEFHARVREGFLALGPATPTALRGRSTRHCRRLRFLPRCRRSSRRVLPRTPAQRAAEADARRAEQAERERLAAVRAERRAMRAEAKKATIDARHAAARKREQRHAEWAAQEEEEAAAARAVAEQQAREQQHAQAQQQAEAEAAARATAEAAAAAAAQARTKREAAERAVAEERARLAARERERAEAERGPCGGRAGAGPGGAGTARGRAPGGPRCGGARGARSGAGPAGRRRTGPTGGRRDGAASSRGEGSRRRPRVAHPRAEPRRRDLQHLRRRRDGAAAPATPTA
jgi:dTMP kinase